MAGRVAGKVAVVVGGGQAPGATIGNGRATAIVLAREGARVVVADRDLASAQDTVDMIVDEGGDAVAEQVDATDEVSVAKLIRGRGGKPRRPRHSPQQRRGEHRAGRRRGGRSDGGGVRP